jgi:hypothetical protein
MLIMQSQTMIPPMMAAKVMLFNPNFGREIALRWLFALEAQIQGVFLSLLRGQGFDRMTATNAPQARYFHVNPPFCRMMGNRLAPCTRRLGNASRYAPARAR